MYNGYLKLKCSYYAYQRWGQFHLKCIWFRKLTKIQILLFFIEKHWRDFSLLPELTWVEMELNLLDAPLQNLIFLHSNSVCCFFFKCFWWKREMKLKYPWRQCWGQLELKAGLFQKLFKFQINKKTLEINSFYGC